MHNYGAGTPTEIPSLESQQAVRQQNPLRLSGARSLKLGDVFCDFSLLNAAGTNPGTFYAAVGSFDANLLEVGTPFFLRQIVGMGNLVANLAAFVAYRAPLRHCSTSVKLTSAPGREGPC